MVVLSSHQQLQLAHIKALFQQAEHLVSDPSAGESNLLLTIIILDFAVESFLKLVIRGYPAPNDYEGTDNDYKSGSRAHLNAHRYNPTKYNEFARSWDEVTGIIKHPDNGLSISMLPQQDIIFKLHDARNKAQHDFTVPHPSQAQDNVKDVEFFFQQTYKALFDEDFDDISFASLIQNKDVRKALLDGRRSVQEEDFNSAMEYAALAHHHLIQDLQQKVSHNAPLEMLIGNFRDHSMSPGLTSILEFMAKRIEENSELIFQLGFGFNTIKYQRILFFLPTVLPEEEKYNFRHDGIWSKDNWTGIPYTKPDLDEVLTFIENLALKIQTNL